MNVNRYLAITDWARRRYTKNGHLTIWTNGASAVFPRIEALDWDRYMEVSR